LIQKKNSTIKIKNKRSFTMKTIYISVSLFCIMLFFLIFSINYLDRECMKLDNINETMEDNIKKETWDKADKNSLLFLKEWETSSHKLSLFIDHKEMDNINNELWKLTQYINCRNKDEALASNNVIKFFIDHVNKMEKINIQNIF